MIPYLFKANQTTFDAGFIGRFENALSCNVVETLNGAFELNMQILNNDPNLENMAIGSIIVAKPNQTYGDQPFIIEQLIKRIDGTIDIYAVHMSQHRTKLIPIAPFTAADLADTISKIAANSQESNPFTITTDKTSLSGFYLDVPKTLRDLMGGSEGSIIDVYGGEWFYSNFDIMLLNRRGRTDSNLKVLYGSNMTEYIETDEFSWSSSYTGILPYYKDENNLVMGDIQYGDHANEYPYKKTIVYDFSEKFESLPTKAQVEAEALSFLNGKGVPHISIEVSFEDLSTMPMYSQLNDNVQYIQLGDTVEIINSAYNTQFKSRVRTLDYDVLLERYNTIKIGDEAETINDVISDISSGSTPQDMEMVDLWTNDSPTSSFASQTIPINLSRYKFTIVVFRWSTTDTAEITHVVPVGFGSLANVLYTGKFYRPYTTAANGLTFDDAKGAGSVTGTMSTYNTALIPIKIYGVR